MSIAGIENFNPITGVNNGKEEENKENQEICAAEGQTKNRSSTSDRKEAARAGTAAALRQEAQDTGTMRWLQANRRDALEVLSVR